jgi:predicted metalloprotease with PDZ domain
MTVAVSYRIGSRSPESHIFELVLTIAKPAMDGQQLALPNWIPGSYMIRDFSRHILGLRAFDAAGNTVLVEKTGKSDWHCAAVNGPLTLYYEVYAWDLSVRGAHLDQTHAFFNGTSVFLTVLGQEDQRHEVLIERPVGQTSAWRVATTLPAATETQALGFGLYSAENYDALIDHPVEMGEFTHAVFMACGVPHEVVITGKHRADMSRLCSDLEKICTAQIKMFGEPAPFDRYVFLVTAVGNGYGGLEHRASTALLCSRDDLPLVTEPQANPGERYKAFLGLCSHEYFHSWNVKRIKPAAFIHYDLRSETLTPQLWAFEGITSYYDDLVLLRAGLISTQSYLELLAQQITRHLRTPGRLQQSVSDSSVDAWTKYYKQDENSPNAIVSYYVKGALIALCLDLLLREKTEDKVSLDHLMRRLWQDFGQTGRGVGDNDIQRLATELCGSELSDFWVQALHGTDELPLSELLGRRGLGWILRAAESASDSGGKLAADSRARPSLGIKVSAGGGEAGASLQHVFTDGPAMRAGLSAGDVVVAVNDLRVTANSLDKVIASYTAGSLLRLHAFRRDELMVFEATLDEAAADTCVLTLPVDADRRQHAETWLLGIHRQQD